MGLIKLVFNSYFNKYWNHLLLKHYRVSFSKDIVINGKIFLVGAKGRITIGNSTKINSGKEYNPIGGDIRTCLYAYDDGYIRIGSNVGISNSTLVSHGSEIIIEDDVLIGGGCKIYDNDFHSINYNDRVSEYDDNIKCKKIVLKKGAFVGAHSIILKGVTIGNRSVIGAGSVVTKNIPDDELWGGNPAQFIKKINMEN